MGTARHRKRRKISFKKTRKYYLLEK